MEAIVHHIDYGVTVEQIAETKARYAALTCDTTAGYEQTRIAIGECRTTRTAIENRRKELKADALEYGRRVDSTAKMLTAAIEEIEEPLKLKKHAVDEAKKLAKEAAERAKREALEAELRAAREAEETRLRAAREEEERRLAEEKVRQEAEAARLREERAAIEADRRYMAEQARLAQEAAAAERTKLDAARRETERLENERLAREAAAEQARVDAERRQAEKEAAELRAAEHTRKLEAMRPDREKLAAFASALRAVLAPDVLSADARELLGVALSDIASIAGELEAFGS
mgnify:CR=1 FL=1